MFDQLAGELGLKALSYEPKKGMFTSPQRNAKVWGKDCLESATCYKCKDGDIPGNACVCGLYATFRRFI